MAPRGIELELLWTFSTERFIPGVIERVFSDMITKRRVSTNRSLDGVAYFLVKEKSAERMTAGGRLWIIEQKKRPFWIELERIDERSTRWRLLYDAAGEGWTERQDRTCIEAAASADEIPWRWEYSGELCAAPFACACCGYLTCSEPFGSYEVCPVCEWEQDPSQSTDPLLRGGANEECIAEVQRQRDAWRPGKVQRDPTWEPFAEALLRAPSDDPAIRRAPLYWRFR